jgi:hypothetical protein
MLVNSLALRSVPEWGGDSVAKGMQVVFETELPALYLMRRGLSCPYD